MKEYFEAPKTCPECGGVVEVQGKFLVCTNDLCSGLGTGNLKRWINVLNIDSVGPKIIEMLYEKEIVKEPADFYKLSIQQISELERMGERSATKIVKNLRDKMQITLPEFIAGLNMPNFSTSTAEALMEAGYDTIEKIASLKVSDLVSQEMRTSSNDEEEYNDEDNAKYTYTVSNSKVKGVALKTAQCIVKGMQSKIYVIKNLFDIGITIKQLEKVNLASNKLKGTSFCFTGAIQSVKLDGKRFTRDDMHKLVRENGGSVEESVKKGLTYLVVADPNSISGKTQKAKQLGVNILSEADFFKMVR